MQVLYRQPPPTDIGKPCLDTLDKSGAIAIDIGKIGRKIRSDWIAELAPSLEKRAVTPCAITTCAGCSAVAFNIAILIGIKASDSKDAESVSRCLQAFIDTHHSFYSGTSHGLESPRRTSMTTSKPANTSIDRFHDMAHAPS